MRCKICHHSLVGLKKRHCPGCGRGFDPSDPTTFDMAGMRQRPWIELSIVALVGYLMGLAIVYFETRSTSGALSWDWVVVRKTLLLAAIVWPVTFGFLYAAYRGIFFIMRAWFR